MDWQQIHITTTKEVAALVEDVLLEFGALAVTYQDAANQALFEPAPDETPLWDQVDLTALFNEDADLTEVIAQLSHQFPALDCEVEYVPDQEWERAWLKDFKPMQFGSNTWICPTGFDPPDPEAINILLDPGLAFGTGTHPTTALCLAWLDENDIQGQNAIDYGCGSGILAIAALKHGAANVIAIDHDPQALTATQDNAKRNDIDLQQLTIILPQDCAANTTADIILANILAQPLLQLAETFANQLTDYGTVVLSGILAEQRDLIIDHYQTWFENFDVTQKEDWLRITANKK